MMSFIFGTYLDSFKMPMYYAPLPILFFIIFCTLPDTPQSYLERGLEKVGRISLQSRSGNQINPISGSGGVAEILQTFHQ